MLSTGDNVIRFIALANLAQRMARSWSPRWSLDYCPLCEPGTIQKCRIEFGHFWARP